MKLVKADPKSAAVTLRSTFQFVALLLLIIGLGWVIFSSHDSGDGSPLPSTAQERTQ